MVVTCFACGLPLTGEDLTCTSCGQAHQCLFAVEQQPNGRTAYQAARILTQAGLSKIPVQDLAAGLKAGRVVFKTFEPVSPHVSAELAALGCQPVEGLQKIPAWQGRLRSMRDRYGLGAAIWKPLLILFIIFCAQKIILAAGPSSDIVAQAESDNVWKAETMKKRANPDQFPVREKDH